MILSATLPSRRKSIRRSPKQPKSRRARKQGNRMPRKYDKIGPEGAQHIRHLVADLGVKDTASFLQAGLDARLTGHHETYISRIANGHYYPDAGGPKTRGKRLRLPARALTELMREVNVTQNYLGKPVSIEKLAKKYRCDAGTLKLRVVNKVMDVIR